MLRLLSLLLVVVATLVPAALWGDQRRNKARDTYVLKPGDRVVHLARRFGTSKEAILAANGLRHARDLRAGQEIVIPAAAPPVERGQMARRVRAAPEPAWQRRANDLARRLGLGSVGVARKLLTGRVARRWLRAAGGLNAPRTLRLPVVGVPLGRGWGSGPGGYHLALDLPAEAGTRISSAAPGIVAYAGDELAGYGKVVLIIHSGGLVTLYAHNSVLKTVAGERVRAGTRVALLGSSGISRGPHLHFELLYRGLLCDPLPLLRPTPRGGLARSALRSHPRLTWPRRGGPPPQLRCAPRRRHPEYAGKPHGWRPPRRVARAASEGALDDEEAGSESPSSVSAVPSASAPALESTGSVPPNGTPSGDRDPAAVPGDGVDGRDGRDG